MKEKCNIMLQSHIQVDQTREGTKTTSVISQKVYAWRKQQNTKLHSSEADFCSGLFFPIVNLNRNKIF